MKEHEGAGSFNTSFHFWYNIKNLIIFLAYIKNLQATAFKNLQYVFLKFIYVHKNTQMISLIKIQYETSNVYKTSNPYPRINLDNVTRG